MARPAGLAPTAGAAETLRATTAILRDVDTRRAFDR